MCYFHLQEECELGKNAVKLHGQVARRATNHTTTKAHSRPIGILKRNCR
jgi:hypothetical protein